MKKYVYSLFVFVYLLTLLPMSVFAEGGLKTTDYEYVKKEYVVDLSSDDYASKSVYYGDYPTTGLYYDLLTNAQKKVYNAFDTVGFSESSAVVNYTGNELLIPSSNYSNLLKDICWGAFQAYTNDHPERFWYDSLGWSSSYYTSGSNRRVTSISLSIGCHSSYSFSTVTSFYNQMMAAVNSFTPAGITRYEKLRSIHDHLINTATYDPNYNNSNAAPYGHQPTGCLLSPNLCVCEGYAETFKIFADREGIPCMLVYCPGHVWNEVLMEDGKWYAIDVTWDDPMTGSTSSNYLGYDYYLVGSQTKPGGNNSNTFSDKHPEEPIFTASDGTSIQNPPLSTSSYAPFAPSGTWRTNNTQGNDHPGGSVLKGSNLIFIVPGYTITGSFDFSYYGTVSYSGGNKTGSTFKFTPSGGSPLTYTVIMRGDVNKDAQFNNTDISYVTDISVGKKSYSSTAPETYAGDCNGDGVVDGFDLALLDRYQNGSYNFY